MFNLYLFNLRLITGFQIKILSFSTRIEAKHEIIEKMQPN